jgi:hypothetical protein
MGQSRGAAVPMSGDQDHVTFVTSLLDDAVGEVSKNATAWAKLPGLMMSALKS